MLEINIEVSLWDQSGSTDLHTRELEHGNLSTENSDVCSQSGHLIVGTESVDVNCARVV